MGVSYQVGGRIEEMEDVYFHNYRRINSVLVTSGEQISS
jgi:hypothetical protein